MNNKLYDILKWIVILASPIICTLLTALEEIWHWPIPMDNIVATITAVTAALGALLGISAIKYSKKKMEEG